MRRLDTNLVHSLRLNMQEMTDYEKNLVIIGKVSANLNRSEKSKGLKQKARKDRSLSSGSYSVEGTRICRDAFKFVHCISQNRLTDCIKWYKVNGLTPKVKKSGGKRKMACFLTHDDIQRTVKFISNYAEDHAIILPGRIPGYKDFKMKLLPSSTTKASVFRLYRSAMNDAGYRAVKITTFRRLWNSLLPFIVQAKPMTDLCWVCQKNNYQVYRSANLPDAVKQQSSGNKRSIFGSLTSNAPCIVRWLRYHTWQHARGPNSPGTKSALFKRYSHAVFLRLRAAGASTK
ncbi:uncharacterized protein LOC135489836 [Lineus longissimus]|uniref:uncharacterized protein LOC135489836 n=1 Tax=Lineus longissimus TaxID=88925 RepID=UPI00315CE43E